MGTVPRLVLPDARFHRSSLTAMAEDPSYFADKRLLVADLQKPAAFARYLAALRADAREATPRPPGFVPQTVLWWVEEEEMLCRVVVRHRPNRRLRTYGGHIGYWTRPSALGARPRPRHRRLPGGPEGRARARPRPGPADLRPRQRALAPRDRGLQRPLRAAPRGEAPLLGADLAVGAAPPGHGRRGAGQPGVDSGAAARKG